MKRNLIYSRNYGYCPACTFEFEIEPTTETVKCFCGNEFETVVCCCCGSRVAKHCANMDDVCLWFCDVCQIPFDENIF